MRILAFLLLFFPTPALAWNWCEVTWPPPPEFRGEPVASYDIHRFPPEMVRDICGMVDRALSETSGCAREIIPGKWWIYIRSDLGAAETQCVLQHEKGHVNGWDHSEQDALLAERLPGSLYRRVGPAPYYPLP